MNCWYCNGKGETPDHWGCGDAAGGWANTCIECNGTGKFDVGNKILTIYGTGVIVEVQADSPTPLKVDLCDGDIWWLYEMDIEQKI